MSASISVQSATVARTRELRPSFAGLVRGELLKVGRQWVTWIMALLLLGVIILPALLTGASGNAKVELATHPLQAMYRVMGENLFILRVFSGIFLLIVTARLIGMEYTYGTIRVILARGVSRLELLFAQLTAIVMIALTTLILGLALDFVLTTITVRAVTGNLDAFKVLDANYWADTRTYALTIALNMAVTILMATAMSVLGRSLAFGLSGALAFFPVDNFAVIFLLLANKLTGSDFWLLATGDLLGPNLNQMARAVLPTRALGATFDSGFTPLVPVTGAHTLLIAGIWSAAFAVIAIVLTWKRDVKE